MDLNIKKLLSEKSLMCNLLDIADIREGNDGKLIGNKRKHAYITEKFFENRILPIITDSEYITRGWIRFYEFGDKSKICWIKVAFTWNKDAFENEADKAFISESLSRNQNLKFYTIGLDNNYFYTVRQLTNKENEYKFSKINAPSFIKVARLSNELNRLNALIPKPSYSNEIGFCEPWLRSYSEMDVFTLLTERVLMNKGLFGCVDIDAIEYNPNSSEKIIFHEFKRKYPFPDRAFCNDSNAPLGDKDYDFRRKLEIELNELLLNKQILESPKKGNYLLKSSQKDAYKEIDKHLNSIGYSIENKLNDVTKEYFGIDGSHCETIELCLSMGFCFNHTIWDSTKVESPYELLVSTSNPTDLVHLYSKTIYLQELTNITRTVGPDSGSFNHGVRLQFTIDADKMRKSVHRTIAPT